MNKREIIKSFNVFKKENEYKKDHINELRKSLETTKEDANYIFDEYKKNSSQSLTELEFESLCFHYPEFLKFKIDKSLHFKSEKFFIENFGKWNGSGRYWNRESDCSLMLKKETVLVCENNLSVALSNTYNVCKVKNGNWNYASVLKENFKRIIKKTENSKYFKEESYVYLQNHDVKCSYIFYVKCKKTKVSYHSEISFNHAVTSLKEKIKVLKEKRVKKEIYKKLDYTILKSSKKIHTQENARKEFVFCGLGIKQVFGDLDNLNSYVVYKFLNKYLEENKTSYKKEIKFYIESLKEEALLLTNAQK